MASNITVSQLVSEYGEYYDGNPENKNKLTEQLREKPRTAQAFKPHYTKGQATIEKLVNEEMDEVVQSYQETFTPKTTNAFPPNTIELFNLKIDFKGSPDKFRNSFLAQLDNPQSNQDRKTAPYVAHVMDQLMKQSVADRETKSYRNGRYVAPSSGTAGNAINAMDGLVYTFREAVKAGGANFALSTDPSNVAQALDAFEEAANKLPSTFDGQKICFWADPTYVRNYLKDRRNTHGADMNYRDGNLVIDFSDIYGDGVGWEIKPLQALKGTGMIAVSPYDNVVHARPEDNMPEFQVDGLERQVSIYTDWWEGFGVVRNELIYVFDSNWSMSASESGTVV